MEAVVEQKSVYLQEFEQHGTAGLPAWWAQRREAAVHRFEETGFPTRKVEAWKQTRLEQFKQKHYGTATAPGAFDEAAVARLAVLDDAPRVVLVDGFLDSGRSSLDALPRGVRVRALREAVQDAGGIAEKHLASHADVEEHAFLALNTALCQDGLVIEVDANVQLEQPIEMVHVSSGARETSAAWPRVLIHAGTSAEVTLVQRYTGPDGADYLVAPVTEVIGEANSQVTVHQVMEEGDNGLHFGVVHATVQRDGRFRFHGLDNGARMARTDLYANLDGPGANADLNGLYLLRDGQFTDFHTWVRHNSSDCTSNQHFKGVLDGKSEAVFDGTIRVAEGAQKTDAEQHNSNLLISKRALAHSNPRLEIWADDVKCTHGSTVGQLDENAVFYLRTRGVSNDEARGILTFAFANDVLESVDLPALQDYEREALFRLLPGDDTVRELV